MMHLIIHMFNTSMIPYISLDQYLKPQFIHYTKYAKYAFLLLFSIYTVIEQEDPWYLDRSSESLSGGENVYHKI